MTLWDGTKLVANLTCQMSAIARGELLRVSMNRNYSENHKAKTLTTITYSNEGWLMHSVQLFDAAAHRRRICGGRGATNERKITGWWNCHKCCLKLRSYVIALWESFVARVFEAFLVTLGYFGIGIRCYFWCLSEYNFVYQSDSWIQVSLDVFNSTIWSMES